MFPFRVFWTISLLAGAEVASLHRLADHEEARRNRVSYEEHYAAAALFSAAEQTRAVDEWEERNAICQRDGQCAAYDNSDSGGPAQIPCEERPLPGDASEAEKCRLADLYMLETDARVREFLQLRSAVLQATALTFAAECVDTQDTTPCARKSEMMAQTTSFLSKARSLLSDSHEDLALAATTEKVVWAVADAMMATAAIPEWQRGLLKKLVADGRQSKGAQAHPMVASQNFVDATLQMLDGSDNGKVAERIRKGKVIAPTRTQLGTFFAKERGGVVVDEVLGLSKLIKQEDQIFNDVYEYYESGESEDRSVSLVESGRVVSAEAAPLDGAREALKKWDAENKNHWAGGVLFVLALVGTLALLLFFMAPHVLPWILVYVAGAVVGCGLVKLGYNAWQRLRDTRLDAKWEASKRLEAYDQEIASLNPLGKMRAAIGLAKETPDERRARKNAQAAKIARAAQEWGALVGGGALAEPEPEPMHWSRSEPASLPRAPAPEDNWGLVRALDPRRLFGPDAAEAEREEERERARIERSVVEWNARRGALTAFGNRAYSLAETGARAAGIWGVCTARILLAPFWLVYKAGQLTFRFFS